MKVIGGNYEKIGLHGVCRFCVVGGGIRAAFANESLTSLGVAIPIMRYQDEYDNKVKGNGVQFALKEHYVFDNGFSLVADLGIGNMKVKDFYLVDWYDYAGYYSYSTYQDGHAFYFDFNVGAGYALANRQRFKLVLSALAGIGFQKCNEEFSLNDSIHKFITFDAGLDLYAAFKFTEHFGAFLSCKGMYSIGKCNYEFVSKSARYSSYKRNYTLKGFIVTPSVGIVICF